MGSVKAPQRPSEESPDHGIDCVSRACRFLGRTRHFGSENVQGMQEPNADDRVCRGIDGRIVLC